MCEDNVGCEPARQSLRKHSHDEGPQSERCSAFPRFHFRTLFVRVFHVLQLGIPNSHNQVQIQHLGKKIVGILFLAGVIGSQDNLVNPFDPA